MRKPILIGVHGVKRAGKNTTADFVDSWSQGRSPALFVRQRGFADKGKWAFARQFFPEITMEQAIEWVDAYKDSERSFRVPGIPYVGGPYVVDVVFRDALAQFCTDGARDIYGDDFWVDQLLPQFGGVVGDWQGSHPAWHNEFLVYPMGIHQFKAVEATPPASREEDPAAPRAADVCVITDVRFPNEVVRIKQLGGYCWKVRRKDAEDAVIEEAKRRGKEVHRSELGIPDDQFDVVFNNDDNDLEAAQDKVFGVMEAIA